MNIKSPLLMSCKHDSQIRRRVFRELDAVTIGHRASAAAKRIANDTWGRIAAASHYKSYSSAEKYGIWQRIVDAAQRAQRIAGCVRYHRNRAHTTQIELQVIACAVEAGLLIEFRSKSGGDKCSRLLPSEELAALLATVPPRPHVVRRERPPIIVRERETGQTLTYDDHDPVAVETAEKVQEINGCNRRHEITFTPFDPLSKQFVARQFVASDCYRLFHANWAHGRLYTRSRFGHTSLRKEERPTICFDGRTSVELDYSALHPRMIYHRNQLECPKDPYALWGERTTPFLRTLAKLVLNVVINAKSNVHGACYAAMAPKKDGKWKTGREWQRARDLRMALRESGLELKEVISLTYEIHTPIAHHLGNGMGAQLMRLDSDIALDVLYALAQRDIPALGVHDSFIVPSSCGDELRRLMMYCYYQRLKFYPVVK